MTGKEDAMREVPLDAAAVGRERVAGECPMGCGQTLFLGAGGHVTCSWIECPNPGAADEILSRRPPTSIERLAYVLAHKAMNDD